MTQTHEVDFVISAGNACRPAFYTSKLGLRLFASPCDWMMNYSLDVFMYILESEANDMFADSYIDEERKWCVDKKHGMISMHHFNHKYELSQQLPHFMTKMKRRAINTASSIRNSKSVGIVMNRDVCNEELIYFANKLQASYPQTTFHILNILDHCGQEDTILEYNYEEANLSIRVLSFDDSHINGRDKTTNPLFWVGCEEKWEQVICSTFKLTLEGVKIASKQLRDKVSLLESKLKETTSNYLTLSLLANYHRIAKNYRLAQIKSIFAWGKRRTKYIEKKKKLKEILRKARAARKESWNQLLK